MQFEERVENIRKVLFEEYQISEKINANDWNDEATEMALLISITTDTERTVNAYNDYLVNKFSDDTYTDFELLAKKITNVV